MLRDEVMEVMITKPQGAEVACVSALETVDSSAT